MPTLPDSSGSTREVRAFPLGVVLSVTQSRLACEFGQVHEFIEYLLGEPVWTLGLVAAFEPCQAYLHGLFPGLAGVEMPDDVAAAGEVGISAWVKGLAAVHGDVLTVPPMPPGSYSAGGFLGELERIKATGKPAAVVVLDGGDS